MNTSSLGFNVLLKLDVTTGLPIRIYIGGEVNMLPSKGLKKTIVIACLHHSEVIISFRLSGRFKTCLEHDMDHLSATVCDKQSASQDR
jgi:hypothetical protein